tara:strand:- start:1189 stop:1974 length:786 start_codon:yes stop_codon:yes gene_type:complete
MNIKLKRPIVFFDLETTGLSKTSDRIVEIAMTKLHPDGSKQSYYSLVNPGMNIPKEAEDIHHISNTDVMEEPSFENIANEVLEFIKDSDLGGFNIHNFDIPFLFEEFARAGIVMKTRDINVIDPSSIVRKMEKRDLGSLYKRYTGKDLENAHSAVADNDATIEIFEKQLELYNLPNDVSEIHDMIYDDKNRVDMAGKFKIDKERNTVIFNFGKYSGKTIREVFDEDSSYFSWIVDKSSMPTETKTYAKNFLIKLNEKPLHL